MVAPGSHEEWLAHQPPEAQLESLLRQHSAPAYGYSYRHLGGDHGMEAQCRCGIWFPAHLPERHLMQVLTDAGYRKEAR